MACSKGSTSGVSFLHLKNETEQASEMLGTFRSLIFGGLMFSFLVFKAFTPNNCYWYNGVKIINEVLVSIMT
jgi:hypothetical protein